MAAAPRNRTRANPLFPGGLAGRRMLAAALVVLLGATGPVARGQNPEVRRDGLFVTVPSQIDDAAVKQIESKVRDALQRQGRIITTIVFDFNPNGQPVGMTDFDACNRLRRYIRDLRRERPRLHTVAFVRADVTRHTVLPVFACHEVVMAPAAKIGAVLRDQQHGLDPDAKVAYGEVARQWPSPDLIWKMVYADLVVRPVKTRDGVRYLDEKKLDEAAKALGPLSPEPRVPELEAGAPNTLFDSTRARRFGLCKAVYSTRPEVARAYNLSPRSLRENTLPADRSPVVWRIDLSGTVNKSKLDSLERRLKTAVGRGANLIVLYLDCEGGETVDVATTAKLLGNLRDNQAAPRVMTIAYIPPRRSLGAATFLALGCDEIVMSKDAVLGDFAYLREAGEKLDATRAMLVALAEEQGYPKALFRATLDPDVVIYRARHKTDPTRHAVLTEAELQGAQDWQAEGRIAVPRGGLLKIDAALARQWDIAAHADIESIEELYNRYQLDPARVRVSRDDWLDKVAEFFRDDLVKLFLIMIGIAGLILELKMPGAALPGITAAVCFVLFFWAHSFVGQFTMLAVLLFILGLVLIGIEVFVLPGFGVTGISGLALVIGSLVLVTLERMPETTEDWVNVGATVTTLGVSLVAAIIGAFVLAWYLPHIPVASRLVLNPPAEAEGGYDGDALGGRPDQAQALIGAIGVAATTLRPAGKVRFGDDYLDVIAEGDYVNPGSRVQVIEIEGNRIVVKEV